MAGKKTKTSAGETSTIVDVTIRVSRDLSAQLDGIVASLKANGLDRVEEHKLLMIISGCIEDNKIEALKEIKGVELVRKDQTYRAQDD